MAELSMEPQVEILEISKIHPLDELDPNLPMDATDRVVAHQQALDRIVERKNLKDKDLGVFYRDGIGEEVFIRRVREENGQVYEVAAGIDITGSSQEKIAHTPHTVYTHPKNLNQLISADSSERQRIFREEILPSMEYVVIIGNGWGGKGKNFERYAMKLLNGDIKGAKAMDKDGNTFTLTKEDLEKTMVINIDTMGACQSLNPDSDAAFTDKDLSAQWWEAIDRVGIQMTNIKIEGLKKIAPIWNGWLKEDLVKTYDSIYNQRDFDITRDEHSFLHLLQMQQQMQDLASGAWWNKSLSVKLGHSMFGLISLETAVASSLIDKPDTVSYRREWENPMKLALIQWRGIIDRMQTSFKESLVDENHIKFLRIISQAIVKNDQSSFTTKGTKGEAPFCMNVAMTPALVGDDVDKKQLMDEYEWLFYQASKDDLSPETANQAVSLHHGADKPLLSIPKLATDLGLDNLRQRVMEIIKKTPILRYKIDKHTGGDTCYASEEVRAGHIDEFVNNPQAISQDSANLKRMRPPFTDLDLSRVSIENWSSFIKNVAVYVGGYDKTLKSSIMRQLGKHWGLNDNKLSFLGGIIKESGDSGHYFSPEGVEMLVDDLHVFIARNKTLRQEEIRNAYIDLYNTLDLGRGPNYYEKRRLRKLGYI